MGTHYCTYCYHYGTDTRGTAAHVVRHADAHPVGDPRDMARPVTDHD